MNTLASPYRLILALLTLLNLLFPVAPAIAGVPVTGGETTWQAAPRVAAIPTLEEFIPSVTNGQADVVTGVHVAGTLALRVTQQPANNPAYVSPSAGYATQFGFANRFGTTGLLAHNYLSGALFFKLAAGQEVSVIYGDGSVQRSVITGVRRFQALRPTDPYSPLVDLDNPTAQLSSTDVFLQVYASGNSVVFQTCISANGSPSWGRLFVTATPL